MCRHPSGTFDTIILCRCNDSRPYFITVCCGTALSKKFAWMAGRRFRYFTEIVPLKVLTPGLNSHLLYPSTHQRNDTISTSVRNHTITNENMRKYQDDHEVRITHGCKQMQSSYETAGKRHRSRAIAIKKLDQCAEELALINDENSNRKMYDLATWRMYNRIIYHRQNNQRWHTRTSRKGQPNAYSGSGLTKKEAVDYNAQSDRFSDYYGDIFQFDI